MSEETRCERCEGDGSYSELAPCTTSGRDCACNGPRVVVDPCPNCKGTGLRPVSPDPPAEHRPVHSASEAERLRQLAAEHRGGEQACGICGDPEPHHVHYEGKRIEGYFTVGRGQSDFDAARSWKSKAQAAASLAAQATKERDEARAGHDHQMSRVFDGVTELGERMLAVTAERDDAVRRAEILSSQHLRGTELETVSAERDELREALSEVHAYLRLKGTDDHRRHGEACGADACILCLCVAVIENALPDPIRED